ncbi:hypothetical protein N665_0156s0014 [Sinapis alba]|nr:hypothetical protein N665_0156s0014 [Sinapis alba]
MKFIKENMEVNYISKQHHMPRRTRNIGVTYDGHLVFMTRWTVLSASWGHGEIFNEPPCSNLQFLNTSNEKSLAVFVSYQRSRFRLGGDSAAAVLHVQIFKGHDIGLCFLLDVMSLSMFMSF